MLRVGDKVMFHLGSGVDEGTVDVIVSRDGIHGLASKDGWVLHEDWDETGEVTVIGRSNITVDESEKVEYESLKDTLEGVLLGYLDKTDIKLESIDVDWYGDKIASINISGEL